MKVSLDRVAELLNAQGIPAYVEQTGGGCATVYAGQLGEPDEYGEQHWQAASGIGWFEGPAWTNAYAETKDLYVGPDGYGDADPLEVPSDADETVVASMIANVVNGSSA